MELKLQNESAEILREEKQEILERIARADQFKSR